MKLLDFTFGRWDGMHIGTRLVTAFLLVLTLTALLAAVSLLSLSRVNQSSKEMADKWMPGADHASTARAAILELREFEVKHSRAADASSMAEYDDKMKALLARATANLAPTASSWSSRRKPSCSRGSPSHGRSTSSFTSR